MELEVIIFNLFGNKIVAQRMGQENLLHNIPMKMTAEKLFELSKTYDVTVRTRDGITRVFLALQSTFLPGDYSEQE